MKLLNKKLETALASLEEALEDVYGLEYGVDSDEEVSKAEAVYAACEPLLDIGLGHVRMPKRNMGYGWFNLEDYSF